MAEKKIIYKKDDLHKYVSGEIDIPSQLIEGSQLQRHCSKKHFRIFPNIFFMLLATCLLSLGVILISFGNKELSLQNYTGLLGVICIGIGLINAEYLFSGYFKNLIRYRDSLKEPLEEVLYLREYLVTYLKNLDTRTSRYFSLITDNKASNYLLINNIKIVLQDKINEIEECLNMSGSGSLRIIDNIMRGELKVCDGIDPYSGNMHLIPFSRLAETIDNLISNMERSIKVLEADLKIDHEALVDL